jgi:hypothetical protein
MIVERQGLLSYDEVTDSRDGPHHQHSDPPGSALQDPHEYTHEKFTHPHEHSHNDPSLCKRAAELLPTRENWIHRGKWKSGGK